MSELTEAIDEATSIPVPSRPPLPPIAIERFDAKVDSRMSALEDNPDYVLPWHQQPNESDTVFKYFRLYRDLGPDRSLKKVALHHGKSLSLMEGYSQTYDWGDRIRAYDQHREVLYQQQVALAIRETAERHASTIARTIDAISAPIRVLLERQTDEDFIESLRDEDPADLTRLASQTAKILPMLMNAERLARGMPSELVEVSGTIDHRHEVVPAERDKIAEVLAALDSAGILDRRLPVGDSEEIIDAEVVAVHQESTDGT